jgi:hypothetical protein
MSSLLVIFIWGGESGQKQSVKLLQNMVHSTFQHSPPPPQSPIICIYCTVHWEGGEGGGGQIEGTVEGQQYTSKVPSSMGATVHNLGRKFKP